jgi:phosphohistidine phosphatase
MKRLFLLRHAEAGWGTPTKDDFDRTLSMRGKRLAPVLGRHMQRLGYAPTIALCSPALRTRETWGYVSDALDGEALEDLRPEFYLAEPATLLDALRTLEDAHPSAIVINHNPGILALALGLAADDIRAANPFGEYPPAALAVFDFDVASWSGLKPGDGTLVGFTRPEDL